MRENEIIVRIAGAAGDGVQSAGAMLSKYFQRSGLYVFTYNYYQDLIRGGESWFQIRASDQPVRSQGDHLEILIALNKDGVIRHTNPNINEGGASVLDRDGIVIFDEELNLSGTDPRYRPLLLSKIAKKHSTNPLLKNTVALGAAIKAIGFEIEPLLKIIEELFAKKAQVVEENKNACKEGFETFQFEQLKKLLKKREKQTYLMTGGEAVGLGAVMAGMKAYFAYPMTPASSVLHWLANHAVKYSILVKIAEDEISAINMAIGANYSGIRAMTGTSGGGFALMTEALGMAGMMEVPLVVYEAQRSGPSTGLPTKTEQGDLNQVLGAAQGDYPKIVIAPKNVADCFYCVREAFNIAEKYQLPVIVMSDLYLAERSETVEDLDLNYQIEHGKIADENMVNFKRYEYTEDGISYRALPGTKRLMHEEDSDEHDEYGEVVSDAITDPVLRTRSMEKRMRKLETYIKAMPPTFAYRAEDANIVIVQWGSTQGVVEECVDLLRKDGFKAGVLEINRVYPLNPDIKEKLKGKRFIVVENNYSGQFATLLKGTFGLNPETVVRKYDGEAFYTNALYEQLKDLILKMEVS